MIAFVQLFLKLLILKTLETLAFNRHVQQVTPFPPTPHTLQYTEGSTLLWECLDCVEQNRF